MLDHKNGEKLAGLETFQYRIEPTGKYRSMLVFQEAMRSAAAQFENAGALKSIRVPHFQDEDVLIQHYPGPQLTVAIFHRKVAGNSRYATATFNTDKDGNPVGKTDSGRRN